MFRQPKTDRKVGGCWPSLSGNGAESILQPPWQAQSGASSPPPGRGEDTDTPRSTDRTPAGDHVLFLHPTTESPFEDSSAVPVGRGGVRPRNW